MWISWRAGREGIKEAVTHPPSRWSGSYLVIEAPLPPLQSMVGSDCGTESLSSLFNSSAMCLAG